MRYAANEDPRSREKRTFMRKGSGHVMRES